MHKLYAIIQLLHNYHLQQFQQEAQVHIHISGIQHHQSIISGATNNTYAPSSLNIKYNILLCSYKWKLRYSNSNNITITVYGNLTSGVIGNSQTICYNTVPAQLSFTTLPDRRYRNIYISMVQ